MSLFPDFFGGLNDDPFFGRHFQDMNRMFDPFQMFRGFPALGGMGSSLAMAQPMMSLNSMMSNFGNAGHSYSHSSVMTMSRGPDGNQQVYHSSESTRTAPGGVKETKKAVSDSRSGTKRLAIGRHIGDRGHVRERVHDYRSGQQEESEDYINIDEEDADQFNREWRRKTRDINSSSGLNALGYRAHEDLAERRHRALPAITSGRAEQETGPYVERPRKRPRYEPDHVTIEQLDTSDEEAGDDDADEETVGHVEEVEDEEEVEVETPPPTRRPKSNNTNKK